MNGAVEKALTDGDESDLDSAWSPDGEQIAFASGSPSGIHLMDADGGDRCRLTTDEQSADSPAWAPTPS